MKLSVIVPVYNCENFIRECFDSILNQTYSNLELIIVDDGSTDGAVLICDDYEKKDKRVHVYHIPNGGVSNARNIGISKASGEYITFVDADDFIDLDTYNLCIKTIENTNTDILCFGINVQKESNGKYIKYNFKNKGIVNNFISKPVYMHSPCNKIYRKKIICDNNILFSTELKTSEDLLFNYCLVAKSGNINYLDKYLYYYRCNITSATHKNCGSSKQYLFLCESINNYSKKNNIDKKFRKYLDYINVVWAVEYLRDINKFSISEYKKNVIGFCRRKKNIDKISYLLIISASLKLYFINYLYIYLKKIIKCYIIKK